jgi:hypothetical protein
LLLLLLLLQLVVVAAAAAAMLLLLPFPDKRRPVAALIKALSPAASAFGRWKLSLFRARIAAGVADGEQSPAGVSDDDVDVVTVDETGDDDDDDPENRSASFSSLLGVAALSSATAAARVSARIGLALASWSVSEESVDDDSFGQLESIL